MTVLIYSVMASFIIVRNQSVKTMEPALVAGFREPDWIRTNGLLLRRHVK